MVFVDTSAWFASTVPSDPEHARAAGWLAQNRDSLITTDYVVDETLTLLRIRGESHRAVSLGEAFFGGAVTALYYVSKEDVAEAWAVFRGYSDKEWSFPDCASKVVMARLGLTTAFAFDHHFHQFATVAVVPHTL